MLTRRTCPSGRGSDGSTQYGALLRAIRAFLKGRGSARRGGDYNKVSQAIWRKIRPSPSNCVTPFLCELLSKQDFGFRKAGVLGCRVFASHFPGDEVQDEAEVRGSTPVFLFPREFRGISRGNPNLDANAACVCQNLSL